jgi:hypothetical protein
VRNDAEGEKYTEDKKTKTPLGKACAQSHDILNLVDRFIALRLSAANSGRMFHIRQLVVTAL